MTSKANPYQTPTSTRVLVVMPPASHHGKTANRTRFAAWLLVFLYPVWLPCSFYLTWLIAWAHLGHRPRPMLDDPKYIGGMLDIVYYMPGALLLLMPVLVPMGFIASFFCPINRGLRPASRAPYAALYVVLCAVALLTLRLDPGRVVEWWFD